MNVPSYRDVSQIRARSLYHRPWFHSPPASIENRRLFRNAFLTFPMPPPVLPLRQNTNPSLHVVFLQSAASALWSKELSMSVFSAMRTKASAADPWACSWVSRNCVTIPVGLSQRGTRCHHNSNEDSGETDG